jgi:hypothetical protein
MPQPRGGHEGTAAVVVVNIGEFQTWGEQLSSHMSVNKLESDKKCLTWATHGHRNLDWLRHEPKRRA